MSGRASEPAAGEMVSESRKEFQVKCFLVVLAELATQLRSRRIALDLARAPRDQNEYADALTNGDFAAFDPGRRVEVDVQKVPWEVMGSLFEVAEDIYRSVRETREARAKGERGAGKARPRAPGERLRQRAPW